MSYELYTNNPGSTLSSAAASTDTTISVASNTGYPASGNFRVRIDNEIMLVTGVSGGTFAVTRGVEGTTAASHLINATVNEVLTATALTNILSQFNQVGTYANLPASGSIAGATYTCTDAPYRAVYDGANWNFFLGHAGTCRVYPPALQSSWSWDNQNSSTVTSTAGYFSFYMKEHSSTAGTIYYRAKTAPYTITCLFDYYPAVQPPMSGSLGSTGWGLAFRDSSGKLENFYVYPAGPGMALEKWNSSSSYNAGYDDTSGGGNGNWAVFLRPFWMKLQDDGTNFTFSWSIDGQAWQQYGQHSRTTFTSGSNACGIWCYCNTADVIANVLSWQES